MDDQAPVTPPQAPPEPAPQGPALVTFDEFKKIDIRVAQILEAAAVEKSEKLVRMQVSLGAVLGNRQIVAGIGKHYKPEELVGRKIVVVTNLKPVKLMGQLSEGMLLAASDDQNNLELLSPGNLLPAGSVVR